MIIAVDKPIGPTSHDVVAGARRQLGTRKVGHAGTLDPLASGVLVLLTEEHTRLSQFLTASNKTYLAWVSFGGTTPTLDAEGPLEPSGTTPSVHELQERLPQLFPDFLELSEQRPPNYSAVKQAGVRGYEAARRGEVQDLPARPAGYLAISLLDVAASAHELPRTFTPGSWEPAASGHTFGLPAELAPLPSALIRVEVQAGTYIRSFARDLGELMDSGAFLSGLVRIRSGRIGLEETVEADALAGAAGLAAHQVMQQQQVRLTAEEVRRVRLGQRLSPSFGGTALLLDESNELVAVASNEAGRMRLLAVFPPAA